MRFPSLRVLSGYLSLLAAIPLSVQAAGSCDEPVLAALRVDTGHPWRPPFGIERVGALPVVHAELTAERTPLREYEVVTFQDGRERERLSVEFRQDPLVGQQRKLIKGNRPYFATLRLESVPEEVALRARCPVDGRIEEIARQHVIWPEIEADAKARPARQINPVDLGTILVPHHWLLLAKGQSAVIEVAALSHITDFSDTRLRVWFDAGKSLEVPAPLPRGERLSRMLRLPLDSASQSTVLHVSLVSTGRELWRKDIRTLVMSPPPGWPSFGAVETKLRYDAPIAVHDPKTGAQRPAIDYRSAWDPKLNDVVVLLPNGSRFVFWRGASYVPFWAGAYNTGVSYQWAENLSHPVTHADGTVDYREPMFDSELRYGRVRIIESTASRVHVRWTYQLTDLEYSVLSDQATEDFYFYPDGFGTRVVTLMSVPEDKYQLTELIVLTPQAAFPLEILPEHVADVVYLDGQSHPVRVPFQPDKALPPRLQRYVSQPRQMPMVLRVFQHREDPAGVIYYDPGELLTPYVFDHFHDHGEVVTAAYWGNHWPLTRGKWTGWTINDGVHSGPAHNSVLAASFDMPALKFEPPKPLFASEHSMPDAKGVARNMMIRRWVGLIGKTDASDDVLLQWAHSYSEPPSLELKGARIDFPSYSPERRAMRLVVESPSVEIVVKPSGRVMNPVFELDEAQGGLISVAVDDKELATDEYRWDGKTLWVKASIGSGGAKIALRFSEH